MNYWFALSYAEKKVLLAECRRLWKKVATAYKEAEDRFGYGKACNELLECVWHSLWFVPEDWSEAKEIYEDGVRFGESAISTLSEAGDEYELVRAYFLTSRMYFWGHLIGRREFVKKMPTYAQMAVELSKKLKDAYLIARSSWPAAWSQVVLANNLELGRKHSEEMLKQAKKTKDNFLIGEACFLQLWQIGWATTIEEDPDKLKEMFEEINAFADEAIAHLSLISWEEMIALTYSMYAYAALATEVETDYDTKRILLEKAVEAGRNGLEHAERAGAVWPMTYSLSSLSNAKRLLSSIETDLETKKQLLKEALEFGEKSKLMQERLMPSNYVDRGGREDLLARIKTELAKIETDMKAKRELLEEAVSNMEERLRLFKMYKEQWTLRAEETKLQSAELGFYFSRLGSILTELYSVTNNKRILERIANVYESAVQAFSKAQFPSRVAESHWQISKVHDQLGEYSESAQNFNLASRSYMLAAEKIPQLQDFYSEYASYMEAWAELEKSRYRHENENYAQSREHYRMCSHHLKSTKKWSYLASYYFAWSLLEHAEDLSKLDRPQDAIKAFDEAEVIFEDSMNILREKVGELYSSEEKDEASKLVTIARLRKKYCTGRVLMEEARLSNRKGDKALSAKKYASAARIFEGIVPNLEREEARRELQFAASLCWAWEKMELAEERRDAALFRKAAELFAKAREITRKRAAGLIAVGNSCFCKALELGTKFRVTSNIDFYARAKLQMENAADYYWKAGFEKAALWVKATKRLFDAFVYAGKAEAEADPEKRARFYQIAEKCLRLSAKLYEKADTSAGRMKPSKVLKK